MEPDEQPKHYVLEVQNSVIGQKTEIGPKEKGEQDDGKSKS